MKFVQFQLLPRMSLSRQCTILLKLLQRNQIQSTGLNLTHLVETV